MKQVILLCLTAVLVAFCAAGAHAQVTIDTAFTLAGQIRPSDYPQWPDSVGAEKVLSGFDINKNGKKEFVVLADPAWAQALPNVYRPYLFWFEANGDNTYKLLWSTQIPGKNAGDYSYPDFTVADIDKDGNMEITVVVPRWRTDAEDALLYIYEFDNGAFPTDPTISSDLSLRKGMQYRATHVQVDDVDNDGENEVVVTSRADDYGGAGAGRTLMVHHFFGGDINPGTFGYFEREFIDSSAVLKGGSVYEFGIVDFDKDGKKEIWVSTWDLLSLAIYEATAKDTYVLQADINQARPANDVGIRKSMRWYDADKDGKLEYYCAGITDASNPGNLYMIPSTNDVSTLTTASFVTLTPDLEQIDTWTYEGADIGDVNGDGRMDYIVAGAGIRREIFWYQYKGSGSPADSSNYRMSDMYKDISPTTEHFNLKTLNIGNDIDGDGKKEIFLCNLSPKNGTNDAAIIILESKRISTSVDRVNGILPEGFSLNQNYPNPFNPMTEIGFAIPASGFVSLRVFDMVGREIVTLVNRELSAGAYKASFDASGLPSGTYFYTLKAGTFVETKKMLLLK